MKKIMRVFSVCALFVLVSTVFVGCGEKGCFVITDKAKDLSIGAPIVWNDAYAGKVEKVEDNKVYLALSNDFAEKIHAGVSAKIMTDEKIHPAAFVLLVGGRDESMPILGVDSQIPEARATAQAEEGFSRFIGWLKGPASDTTKTGGGILLVLLAIVRFVKKLVKRLIQLAILVVLVIVAVSTRSSWKEYVGSAESAATGAKEAAAWVQKNAGKIQGWISPATTEQK